MKYLLISILFVCCLFIKVEAQISQEDNQLAFQYFQGKEYDKAVLYYERLFKQSGAKFYFDYYIKCMIELKQFDEAEKIIKKQLKGRNPDLTYYIELGNLYKVQGKDEKATDQYNNVIKKLQPDQSQIITVANAFINKREYDYAENTYFKGRELMKMSFNFELANVYASQRKFQSMIDSYLELVQEDESQLQTVQNVMQYYVVNDFQNEFSQILKTCLLRKIQKKTGGSTVFNELLIWLFMQQGDFTSALIQAKAIDKRNKQDGFQIIELANLALSNRMYDAAYEAFNYVVLKGFDSPFYGEAKIGMLEVQNVKLLTGIIKNKEEFVKLETDYVSTLKELNKSEQTVMLMKNLAHLQAFYLNKTKEAIDLLNEAIAIRTLSPQTVGTCKIELGDILLLSGEIWDATLIYGQAELANKNNAIGDEAKFRKSKLAYYSGDFKWAQAQLDVLKASTSKLIANDAFELSQLIKDNEDEEDSTEQGMKTYSGADLFHLQNKDSLALITLDTIISKFPKHSLCDNVYFKKAQIEQLRGNYSKTAEYYQKIIDNYGWDILGDDAMFNLAELYETKLNDKAKAMNLYNDVMVKYPGSVLVIEARKRFRFLRGDKSE